MLNSIKIYKRFSNQKGMAVLELIPALFVYMLLINFGLGFFGAIHAGILHNIAARNYTFETLRHRSNVVYHREASVTNNFEKRGYRFGGIIFDRAQVSDNAWMAPVRPVAFTSGFGGVDASTGIDLSSRGPANEPNARNLHNQIVRGLNNNQQNESISVAQIWIKSQYGICITAACGDN
jgi:SLT domain-containing protein